MWRDGKYLHVLDFSENSVFLSISEKLQTNIEHEEQ